MAELIKAINVGGTQYDIDLSSCVPKCASNKMYPYVLHGNYKECYKVILPHQGVTNSSTQWYMISMEIVLGGTYSQGANGKIFLSYYFKKNSDNTWIAEDVRGIAIGCKLIHNGIYIKYDIANPGIFYIKANNNAYNTISIQNLTANDSAPNYNYSLTTIENINESNIPASANKTVPISFIDTNDGNSIQLSSDLILPQYLKIKAWPGYGNGSADLWYDGNIKRLYYQNATDMQLGSNTVIHGGNIGSQSVNYANSAGSATDQTARNAAATAQTTANGKWTWNAADVAGVKVNSASTADSANSVAWDNVTGKPETFPATSHSHSDTFTMQNYPDYVALSFRSEELSKTAGEKYIECWDNAGGWWNWKANKWITVGGTSSNFVKGDGSLDSTVYLPLSGGTLTGNLKWNGSTQEILSFAPADTTWRSGLKYSWSSNTTIGLWGKHSKTQFVWHAGTDFSTTDINGTTTRNYDFQVGRNGSNELEALVGGKKVSLDGHTHTKSQITDFPTSLPASDVYAWAKKSTKPSYKTSEVTEETNLYFTNQRAIDACSGTYLTGITKAMVTNALGYTPPTENTWPSLSNLGGVPINRSNYVYTNVACKYMAGTSPVYYRIVFPDTAKSIWNMVDMEIFVRQSYSNGYSGKILLYTHNDGSNVWKQLNATLLGNLTSDVKVYAAEGKYIYIAGCSEWGTINIDKILIGDGAVNKDLSGITIDYVDSLPSVYQEAIMRRYSATDHRHSSIVDAGNNSSYTTFAYSKAGLAYADYTWLAGWNGYELRAVNKDQFATSGHSHTSFASSVNFVAGLSSGANVTVTGKVSATSGFYEESDSRLKDIEKPLEVDFNDLAKLQKIYFKFKSKPDKTEIGIIAQEVQEIYPEIVSENEDGNLTVAYDKLAVIALAAVDKLNERLERIEKLLSI